MYGEVKDIKQILQAKLAGKPVKSKHTTLWQVRGSEICRELGCKSYPVFFRLYKLDPNAAEKAYYKVREAKVNDKEKLYFWAFWKTHKETLAKKDISK
jgi:hypothetical protein